MRRFLVVPIIAGCLSIAGPAFATGQPTSSRESPGAKPPPGFSTTGFANAEAHYAGSEGTPSGGERQQPCRLAVRHRVLRRTEALDPHVTAAQGSVAGWAQPCAPPACA